MSISRLNDIVVPGRRAKSSLGIFSKTKISCQKVEVLAGTVELVLIAVTASACGLIFRRFFESNPAAYDVLSVSVIVGAFYVYTASVRGLYRFRVLLAPLLHIGRILNVWAFMALLISASLRFLKGSLDFAPLLLVAVFLSQFILLLITRWAFAKASRALLSAGRLEGRRIVTVGAPSELLGLNSGFLLQHYGLQEVARVAVAVDGGGSSGEITRSLGCALAAASEHRAEEFLLAPRWDSPQLLETIRSSLRASSLPVRLLPDRSIRAVLEQHDFWPEGLNMPVRRQRSPLSTTERAVKRVLDVLISIIALVILWPIFLVAAIAIKLDSGGPVIFRQRRTGSNAKEFVVFKFRTMTVLEDGPDLIQVRKGDHRVTAVGKFLRRSSIDELPQLINVLKGDMSLVGPRPHAIAHDIQYIALIADYGFRFHVKPGLTGWAQVNGLRGETASVQQMAERVRFDLWYINNWSIGLDLSILVRTCFELIRDGAY